MRDGTTGPYSPEQDPEHELIDAADDRPVRQVARVCAVQHGDASQQDRQPDERHPVARAPIAHEREEEREDQVELLNSTAIVQKSTPKGPSGVAPGRFDIRATCWSKTDEIERRRKRVGPHDHQHHRERRDAQHPVLHEARPRDVVAPVSVGENEAAQHQEQPDGRVPFVDDGQQRIAGLEPRLLDTSTIHLPLADQ